MMSALRNTVAPALVNLLLLSCGALANPLPTAAPSQDIWNYGVAAEYTVTAVSGAAAAITQAPFHIDAANIANPPNLLTITIINKHPKPISTAHAHNANGPGAVWGPAGAGTMGSGATASVAFPTGWAGNIAVVEYGGGREIRGDESLIEANFVVPGGYSVAVPDVDISYVNGFSLAIVCSCDGAGAVTGCNKDLWVYSDCTANDNHKGSCKNPLRSDQSAKAPTTFFKPCQGGAYTYVNDHAANSFGVCQSGRMTCCIGASCGPSLVQPK